MSRWAGKGYLIGIGSNVNPERNVASAIEAMLMLSGALAISSVMYTKPEGVDSPQWFINAVVFLPSDLSSAALKEQCNQIESGLGRDRSHPQRKWRDRAADLDILLAVADIAAPVSCSITESYLAPLMLQVVSYLQDRALPELSGHYAHLYIKDANKESLLGPAPATIYRNNTSGLIRIVQ